MKEISVIVPCYNVEEYLDACLESLVSQTLGLERMELILVDDASQDATLEHLRAWEREYPEQILVVECAENGSRTCMKSFWRGGGSMAARLFPAMPFGIRKMADRCRSLRRGRIP